MIKTKKSSKKSDDDDDMPDITPVGDVENPRSWAVYGAPGTGKTTLLSSFPKPILLLDIKEKGTDSIRDVKGVDVAEIESIGQFETVYWRLKKGKLKYKTVGIDTTTQLQQLYVEDVSGSDEPMGFGSLTQRQFGEVSGRMKRAIVDYRDLDLETVFLSQQRIFEPREDEVDDGNVATEVGPALMPSIATTLNSNVNFIGQTFKRQKITKKEEGKKVVKIKKIQFCLLVGPNDVRLSKIRKPKNVVPPEFLINPTYADLIEAIEGE